MIHATAIVSDSAKIADDVEIGAYSIIGDEVEIGSGTRIDSHVVVNGPTIIGKDNHIYQFASIGDDPQDKKYADEPTRLIIGDRNTIREFCTFSRGTLQDDSETTWRMTTGSWPMCISRTTATLAATRSWRTTRRWPGTCMWRLGDHGGFSGAHQFCRVGAHAFLGMYAGVNRDVPAYTMVSGTPGVPRGINSEGLKRRDFDAEQIRNIKDAYRVMYRKGLKLDEAIANWNSARRASPN